MRLAVSYRARARYGAVTVHFTEDIAAERGREKLVCASTRGGGTERSVATKRSALKI